MTQIVPTVAVTVPVIDPSLQLTPAIVAGLAHELGMGLRDEADVLATYKIAPAIYEKLKTFEWFNKLVDAATIEWHSATNVTIRTQIEANYAAEQGLPHVYARAVSGKDPLNHVVEAFKWMTDVAGLKKTPNQGQQGERFQINIQLGADTKIEFDGSKAPIDGSGTLLALPFIEDKEDRV